MFTRFVALFVLVGGITVFSQAKPAVPPAKPEAAAKPPVFDELFSARVQTVVIAAQLANQACAGLEAMKQFNTIRLQVTTQYETANPGKTIDWAKLEPVAKDKK